MIKLRHKAPPKCECGKEVSPGSVFCQTCKASITRENAKTIKKEEQSYQQQMRGKGKKGK